MGKQIISDYMSSKYIHFPSENFSDRKPGSIINTIVLHHTATENLAVAMELLTKSEFRVSSHYLIDLDGTVYSLVPEEKKAWHAGISHWLGVDDLNQTSIGIEIVNDGFSNFTSEQMHAISLLCSDIKNRYSIDDKNIIGHSDIAPNRKVDPNINFDWKWLYEQGLGIFSTKVIETFDVLISMGEFGSNVANLRQKLATFGYLITPSDFYDADLQNVITAFKRHYSPESYDIFGWDALADLRLNDLLETYYV